MELANDYGIDVSSAAFLEQLYTLSTSRPIASKSPLYLWFEQHFALFMQQPQTVASLFDWMCECCAIVAQYKTYQGRRYYPKGFKDNYLILIIDTEDEPMDWKLGM